MSSTAVQSYTHFLQRDHLYNEEKPYSLRFTAPNGFPRANIKLDRREIQVADIRDERDLLEFKKHGLAIWDLRTAMEYADFDDEEKVKSVYLKEVADRLRVELGSSSVQIFEHTVRKRHAEFPISTGEPYAYNQPTSIAHVDTTIPWCHAMAQQLNPETKAGGSQRIQCINVWKPLRGPVKDWPLALCEPSSLNVEDLEPCDLVYPDYVVENRQVYHSDEQRWVYLSDQEAHEAWVFLQTDTAHPGITVAHTAFPLQAGQGAMARESVEVRALVYG